MLRNVSSTLRQHPTSLRVVDPSTLVSHVSTSSAPSDRSPKLQDSRFRKYKDKQQENPVTREYQKPFTRSTNRSSYQESKYTDNRSTGNNGGPPWQQKGKATPRFSNPTQQGTRPPLRPFVLLGRLKKLCLLGQYDEAVATLKNSPLDAQNAVVWNGLIMEVMAARKLQLGYLLYTDMKRRGHKPTGYTFSCLMTGYRAIEDWKLFPKQLANVHNVFEAWKEHVSNLRETNPSDPDLATNAPLNMYLTILGKAQLYQKMFDVFNDAHDHGPVYPDTRTYSEIFHRLTERRVIPGVEGPAQVGQKNASDARHLWRQFTKDEEKGLLIADAICLRHLLQLLCYGRALDHLVAFDIIRDYIGLAKPGETPLKPRVMITPPLVSQVLFLPLQSHKPNICIHFADQLMKQQHLILNGLPVLDHHHIRLVVSAYCSLAALGSLGESKQVLDIVEWSLRQGAENPPYERYIRPHISVYRGAFDCSWKSKDWPTAMRLLELMSGYNQNDFLDGNSGPSNPPTLSPGKSLIPDNAICAALARTAYESRNHANMRQCLRIFDHYNIEKLIEEGAAGERTHNAGQDHMSVHNRKNAFYESKLAEATIELVNATLNTTESNTENKQPSFPTEAEKRRWLKLKAKAKVAMKSYQKAPKFHPNYIPPSEVSLIGSEQGLRAMDKAVERTQEDRYMSFKPV
ncbi:hypothetical protein BDY19DRAFT_990338 [Irpex rosettiformis]|uniref:Uncharacterized protein n=1 Tax=Irpex rosettiformis TaxID=378272 RepID=A0ACB8UF11_9APHY|nr:hypothetical protein BDY19DRAFT_990338 [Irpex rosettiformis]